MLKTIQDVFKNNTIEKQNGELITLHSHTQLEQGLFIQKVFEDIKPTKSIEVGLAYGISALFILEKHREHNNLPQSHIIIEPDPKPWDGVAEHNISKEGLTQYCDFRYDFSDKVLPKLYYENLKIQFAYIDTTKLFDIIIQDFYFLDKMLDVNGVIIFDDCGGRWPGVQKVARFVNTLPHYKVYDKHYEVTKSAKYNLAEKIITTALKSIPFKNKFFPADSFKTNRQLKLNYHCLAFQKISNDERHWSWDKPF